MIPSKITSQGLEWTIRYSSDIDDLGQTDWDGQEIIISFSLSPEAQLSTFLHEVFHTLNNTIDHTLLDSITNQLFQVLKDNHICFNHQHNDTSGIHF